MKIFSFILLFFLGQYMFACRCAKKNFEREVTSSEVIVAGKVVNVKNNEFLIKVNYQWKGNQSDTIVLNQNTTSCHLFKLKLGYEYLIYLNDYMPNSISHCSRTVQLKYSQDISNLHRYFKTVDSEEKKRHLIISNNYLDKILAKSNLKEIDTSNSVFLYQDFEKGFLKMNFREFMNFDHKAKIPVLKRVHFNPKKFNPKLRLYTFYYGVPIDHKSERKLVRKFRKK